MGLKKHMLKITAGPKTVSKMEVSKSFEDTENPWTCFLFSPRKINMEPTNHMKITNLERKMI